MKHLAIVQEGALLCGRYRLQQSVGRGGMADVYLAFDNKRQAPVAVKILREDLAEDPDFVRRFRREAEALAQLDHPNIVRFYAFEKDGPVAFIVMDYIEGTTLRRQLHDRHGPLEVKAVTADPARFVRRAALRTPQRVRAPRPEAGQRDAEAGWQGAAHRLRHLARGRGGHHDRARPWARPRT